MILWTEPGQGAPHKPTGGKVLVVEYPAPHEVSVDYVSSDGACMGEWKDRTPDNQLANLFVMFNTLTVRDGIDPQVAHKAFLAIPEYCRAISPDQSGAREGRAMT